MANGGRVIKWNHPSHPHPLTLLDARTTYSAYEGRWRCDVCKRVYDAKRAPVSSIASYRDPGDPDHRHFYHCSRCNFDVCTVCFKGHLHTFHEHRLKKARATIVYKDHDAMWHCDACGTINSEHTDQLCYHCEKCQVDLCSTCFEGKWDHALHANMPDQQEHTLKPVDPRIQYRTYQDWTCDNCNQVFSSLRKDTAFHCGKCNFDLCNQCFSGEKHWLHAHPLVAVQSTAQERTMLVCSHCDLPIRQATTYPCKKQSCQYRLCVNCHSKQPELHPYHSHPLHVCDPLVVYPQSGGLWHCDKCTMNSVNRQPVALSYKETMYHCKRCEYDLCQSCYTEGMARNRTNVMENSFRPVQVAEEVSYTPSTQTGSDYTSNSSGYGTYQPYQQTTYYTSQDYQNRLSRPLVTGFQSFVPQHGQFLSSSHSTCLICGSNEATTTFLHSGIPHSGHPLCCQTCAYDAVRNRRPCPACRIPPDEVFQLPRY